MSLRSVTAKQPEADPAPFEEVTTTERLAALEATEQFIRRYVVLTDDQSAVITLWIAHTWSIEAFDCSPYLSVSSATKRCGKTRLLEVLELVTRNPLRSASITEAALFRILERGAATVMLDEVDTIFSGRHSKKHEGLRALLNAGYRRGSPIQRANGPHGLVSYDVFGAKVLAGIGELPDTVADRSIPIRLERRRTDEEISRFRMRDVSEDGRMVRDMMARAFAPAPETIDYLKAISVATPELPDWLNDRAQDSWEPLFAIAESLGPEWRARAYRSARQLSADPADIIR